MGNRIYFLEYLDVNNVQYNIDIYKNGYTGDSSLIGGYAILEYGGVNNNLENIRGNGLTLNLEASLDLTLEDLYTEDENTFTIELIRGGNLLFSGFIKPDGIFQDFVNDKWEITLECVDGLGVLENLAFVQEDGFPFIGKLSALEIINNCLRRSKILLKLNTSVNIYYEGLTPSDELDPFNEIYMSVSRFVKDDKKTIMDCAEVLKSVLLLFNAVISQRNGQWYIYRPNEIYNNSTVKFRKYLQSEGGLFYSNIEELNLSFNLGSHINNKYPHHCNANQRIGIKGSVSAYRINYKYGFLAGLLSNTNLKYTNKDYFFYEEINMQNVIFDTQNGQGIKYKDKLGPNFPLLPIIKSQLLSFLQNEIASLRVNFLTTQSEFGKFITFRIKQGVNYLSFDSSFDQQQANWTTSPDSSVKILTLGQSSTSSYSFNFPPFLQNGDLTVEVIQPNVSANQNIKTYQINSIDIINITDNNQGAVGEFHTVLRTSKPSSIAKDVTEIYNGDSPSIIYEGAVFKSNQSTPTNKWFRQGKTESFKILQIAAEDVLRAQQLPSKEFTGNVFGYVPYLSLIDIDGVTGKFMPIQYNFDTKNNITSLKSLELFGDELTDIDYKFTLDFGNTVKPTII
jgi:hypothetical protein